ncbi:MAG: SH3 domain-containing protein [Thermomicrobiales bacterium]|nr:SH3 domain-containing protein [Thermomicrobiales bacterium]MCO5224488.1 SH3 domain-containing protein [Thermomicrobiales bacterium]MCO5228660.1 SH3 domain-containing protein [Thermomicrobiales bacterium]
MTDSGLNQRLRQRSRRSGLMIGVSMALTLMVCVGAFTIIFARLEPIVSDFVGQGDIVLPTPVPTQPPVPTEPPVATEPPAEGEETPTSGGDNQTNSNGSISPNAFVPDFQTDAGRSVNLRPGPGISSGEPIVAVPNGAPLMFLGDEEQTSDPTADDMNPDQVWMRFRTQDGEEGWIREIDVIEYQP